MRNPEQQRAYRAKRKAEGRPLKSGKSGKAYKIGYFDHFFVSIDSEGRNYSKRQMTRVKGYEAALQVFLEKLDTHIPRTQDILHYHRTFLWGALASAPSKDPTPYWLEHGGDKPALSSAHILDWLCTLRSHFGPRAIYIAFAFSYDATQALADMPFKKMQELQDKKNRRYIIWAGYAIRYIKGRYMSVARMNAGPVYRKGPPSLAHPEGRNILNCGPRITIYDVWGFFQSSLLNVLESIPGCASGEDLAIIKRGKEDRGDFTLTPLEEIKIYTSAEMRALNKAMLRLRDSLAKLDLKLARWNGAGAISGAAMTKYQVRQHYPPIGANLDELPEHQKAAMHAFFGGRIELIKHGTHRAPIYSYDIASAYPSAQVNLPAMAGGGWTIIDRLPADWSLDEHCSNTCPLSMIQVGWRVDVNFPFGPLPYRTPGGGVYYPPRGRGIYCLPEVRAALRAQAAGMPVEFVFERAFWFEPCTDVQPFSYFLEYYAERARLVRDHKNGAPYDMREKVLKLALNASYGKTAQRVGNNGYPPATACPYYAAAITAITRARLLDAAMLDPHAIIMMATDGIYSTRPLPLEISADKRLGGWEGEKAYSWGQFVQSGYYLLEGGVTYKTRGVARQNLGTKNLSDIIDAAWRNREKEIKMPYRAYITVGAASRSEFWAGLAGCWIEGERALNIAGAAGKRESPRKYGAPNEQLIESLPACTNTSKLSALYVPDWMNTGLGGMMEMERDADEACEAKGY